MSPATQLTIAFLCCLSFQYTNAQLPYLTLADQKEFLYRTQYYTFVAPMTNSILTTLCTDNWGTPGGRSTRLDISTISNAVSDMIYTTLQTPGICSTPFYMNVDPNRITYGPADFDMTLPQGSRYLQQRICVSQVATCEVAAATTPSTTTVPPGNAASLNVCQLLGQITPYATPNISQICNPANQAVMLSYVTPFGPILTDIFSKAVAKVCVNNAFGYVDLLDFYKKEICTKVVCTVTSC